MEFRVIKCLLEGNYDDLLKSFGVDKNKALFELEQYLGRKVVKPQPEVSQQAAPKPVQNALQSALPEMSAGDAFDFFSQLGRTDNAAQQKPSQPEIPAGH